MSGLCRECWANAEARRQRLTEALGLSPEQQARIKAALTQTRGRYQAPRRQGMEPGGPRGAGPPDRRGPQSPERRVAASSLRARYREAVLAVLTPAQREKFERLSAAREAAPATQGRVWVLGGDGEPTPVGVVTGISDGSYTEIVRGALEPGRQVIVGTDKGAGKSSRSGPGGRRRFGF